MLSVSRIDRRGFLRVAASAGAGLAIAGRILAEETKAEAGHAPVTAAEDLMREHGLLERVLLVYGECSRRIESGGAVPAKAVAEATRIIRQFVEDYHERNEERYIFPLFEKAGKLAEMTKVLRAQHQGGRGITDRIAALATGGLEAPAGQAEAVTLIRSFERMYRPHASRETTELFPALHEMLSARAYDELGDTLEDAELKLFKGEGFEMTIGKVAAIEKELGIADLSIFTPKPQADAPKA